MTMTGCYGYLLKFQSWPSTFEFWLSSTHTAPFSDGGRIRCFNCHPFQTNAWGASKRSAHIRKSITSCWQTPTCKEIKRRRHFNTNPMLPNAYETHASIGKMDQQCEFCITLKWPEEHDGQVHQERSACRYLTAPQIHFLSCCKGNQQSPSSLQ